MRHIDELIIHTTATPNSWMRGKSVADKVAEITRWHKKLKFDTIGYHRIIDRDGAVGMGRPYADEGAHVKGHNKNSIGISLVGGQGGHSSDEFSTNFTEFQRDTLWKFIDDLRTDFGNIKISGHNEYSNKDCPCFSVSAFLQSRPKPAKVNPFAAFFAMLVKLLGGR